MEARGKQELWMRRKPEVLRALLQQAKVQSVESSNRIEGVTVNGDRLRPIVLGRSKPRDRSEEELFGYRRALDWIFTRKRPVPIEPDVILHLHKLAQGGHQADAGRWKKRDNEIIEIMPNGERRVRFVPTPAKQTPKAIDRLCSNYADIIEIESFPSLLTIATFVLDFLCIHPFRDGNGRVSRLIATILLQQNGFIVGRYISLERLIEETKEEYYSILKDCSDGWHQGDNDIVPWWNYFLSTLRHAFAEFERQVEISHPRTGKGSIVRGVIQEQVGPFTLAELRNLCPSVSTQLIKKVLAQMKKEGALRLTGRGRGARWQRVPQ